METLEEESNVIAESIEAFDFFSNSSQLSTKFIRESDVISGDESSMLSWRADNWSTIVPVTTGEFFEVLSRIFVFLLPVGPTQVKFTQHGGPRSRAELDQLWYGSLQLVLSSSLLLRYSAYDVEV